MRTRNESRIEPVFFLDRSLGKHTIAEALRQAGEDVRIHDDHFRQDTTDEEWLRQVGEQGWIVLTKDKQIRRRSHERAALIQAGVKAFVLAVGNLSGREMAEVFVKALPAIHRFIASHDPSFIAKVTRSGAVSLLTAP